MSEVIQRTVEEVEEIAKTQGLVAVLPREDEIMLDIDQPTWKIDQKLVQVLSDNGYQLNHGRTTISKNKKRHVYYRTNRKLTDHERILLQAILGSDSTRELLSMIRLTEGSKCPTALFETKAMVKLVEAWRKDCDKKDEDML